MSKGSVFYFYYVWLKITVYIPDNTLSLHRVNAFKPPGSAPMTSISGSCRDAARSETHRLSTSHGSALEMASSTRLAVTAK